jgi:hypothetical protein
MPTVQIPTHEDEIPEWFADCLRTLDNADKHLVKRIMLMSRGVTASGEFCEEKAATPTRLARFFGDPDRIRTCDPQIRNLSYNNDIKDLIDMCLIMCLSLLVPRARL